MIQERNLVVHYRVLLGAVVVELPGQHEVPVCRSDLLPGRQTGHSSISAVSIVASSEKRESQAPVRGGGVGATSLRVRHHIHEGWVWAPYQVEQQQEVKAIHLCGLIILTPGPWTV
jgi:hypothetical protein